MTATTNTSAVPNERPASTGSLDRATVVRLAGDLLDRSGVESLSLTRIAHDAGVTQPALYRHVDSINDLWRELGLSTRAALAERLAAASVGRAGTEAVRAVSDVWRRYGLEHPGRYRSTERYAVTGDPELEASVATVIEILALSLRGFGMSESDTAHGARTLRSALHGFVAFELGDGHPQPLDADDSFDHLVDLLCIGFEAAGSHTSQDQTS